MRPYGQKRVGFGGDEKMHRARAEREALKHEHSAEVGQELDEAPFCELCGGPCDGLGAFLDERPVLPSRDSGAEK